MFEKMKKNEFLKGFNKGVEQTKTFMKQDHDFELQKKDKVLRCLRSELELTRFENSQLKKIIELRKGKDDGQK